MGGGSLSLYLPEWEKSMLFSRMRSVRINRGFQKRLVEKSMALLHAIDGCLAGEESKRQKKERMFIGGITASRSVLLLVKKAIMSPLPCLFVGRSSCCLFKSCTISAPSDLWRILQWVFLNHMNSSERSIRHIFEYAPITPFVWVQP